MRVACNAHSRVLVQREEKKITQRRPDFVGVNFARRAEQRRAEKNSHTELYAPVKAGVVLPADLDSQGLGF